MRKPHDHVDLVHSEVPALVSVIALLYFCGVIAILASLFVGGGS